MSDDPTPEVKALNYIESLGVHSVYDTALAARKELGDKMLALEDARSRRRTLESFKTDVEMAVIEEERGRHTDMSQAQMDKHLKVAFSNNSDLRETRDELIMLAGEVDGLEHAITLLETDIRIAVSRLTELGGLAQFFAVLKQAEITRKTPEDGNPWK